jgi:hypothetical protein
MEANQFELEIRNVTLLLDFDKPDIHADKRIQ